MGILGVLLTNDQFSFPVIHFVVRLHQHWFAPPLYGLDGNRVVANYGYVLAECCFVKVLIEGEIAKELRKFGWE